MVRLNQGYSWKPSAGKLVVGKAYKVVVREVKASS